MRNARKISVLSMMIPAALMMAGVKGSLGGTVNAADQSQDRVQRGRYVDGLYTATGQYGGQPSFITVAVTLKDGIIADVKVTTHATVPESLDYQRRFAAAVPRAVVGKPIDQINIGKLAGSSGTPQGFNAAIRQIKEQAARQ